MSDQLETINWVSEKDFMNSELARFFTYSEFANRQFQLPSNFNLLTAKAKYRIVTLENGELISFPIEGRIKLESKGAVLYDSETDGDEVDSKGFFSKVQKVDKLSTSTKVLGTLGALYLGKKTADTSRSIVSAIVSVIMFLIAIGLLVWMSNSLGG